MNIVLAGMPGSGKTTVAKSLADRGKRVYDTDEEIVKRYGEINQIFSKYGEEHFRDIESLIVEEVSNLSDVVIATGGGCLLRTKNVTLFKTSGKIVFLRTLPETLIKRVEGNTERPLLRGDTRERINKLYKERKPIYESAADLIIDTDNYSPDEIADIILEKFL